MKKIDHVFVDTIPNELLENTLYISIKYKTVVHLCCCGCGFEVVTPLSPTDWKMTFDGETVSLSPSIGNWQFSCRSHYIIKKSKIIWASQWSDSQVAENKYIDKKKKKSYYNKSILQVLKKFLTG